MDTKQGSQGENGSCYGMLPVSFDMALGSFVISAQVHAYIEQLEAERAELIECLRKSATNDLSYCSVCKHSRGDGCERPQCNDEVTCWEWQRPMPEPPEKEDKT